MRARAGDRIGPPGGTLGRACGSVPEVFGFTTSPRWSQHGAFRPLRGGAAGSRTPAAESPAAPPALGITFLGVRRGRRPVIPPPWACGAFFGAPGVSRVHFLGPRGSLGGSWGSPVALLEGSWGVRGPFWSRLFGYEILRPFFDPKREVSGRILEALGCPKGSILGAKMAPKSIPNRS